MNSRSERVPASAIPVGSLASGLRYGRGILFDLAHRAFYRRRRHKDQVMADYDGGEWSQQRSARRWESADSLAGYADKAWRPQAILAKMDGRLWRVPAPDYYAFRRGKLIDVMTEFDLDSPALIELGSGTGSNLFALATAGRWSRLTGLELSSTGREVTDAVARRFGITGTVDCEHIDLLDPASAGFGRLEGQVAFTHYCLEQLPDYTEQVFRNLVQARLRRAILIEPTFELLDRTRLADLASLTYVLRQDYQRTIVRVARKLEAEGLIRIAALRRLDFASGYRQAPTLLVWDRA